jgi:hypothetical protein
MKPVFVVAMAITILICTVGTAASQDAEGSAGVLYEEGKRLFDEGRFDQACPKLEASFKLRPLTGTRGLEALCFEKVDKLASAWTAWRDVATMAARAGENDRRDVAQARIADLEPRMPRLLTVVDRAKALPDMTVTRDGLELPNEIWNVAVPVDAGPHKIVVSAPGHESWSTDVEAENGREVSVNVPVLEGLDQVASHETDSRDAPKTKTYMAWAAGGAGIVALGIGAWAGLDALSKRDAARAAGCSHDLDSCPPDAIDLGRSAHDRGNLSTGLIIGGAALVVTGGILGYYQYRAGQRPAGETARMKLYPAVGATNVGLLLDGTF